MIHIIIEGGFKRNKNKMFAKRKNNFSDEITRKDSIKTSFVSGVLLIKLIILMDIN